MVGVPLIRGDRVRKVVIRYLAVLDIHIEWLPVGSLGRIQDYVVVEGCFEPVLDIGIGVESWVVCPHRDDDV